MRNLILAIAVLLYFVSCSKNEIHPPSNIVSTDDSTNTLYGGDYTGLFYKHVAGVDSNGVYKYDTTYSYTVTVLSVGFHNISIHGETDIEDIPVNDTGYFEFKDYHRNIQGNFKGDSIHIFSDAIGGTYTPPQTYSNTQLKFDGKKQ